MSGAQTGEMRNEGEIMIIMKILVTVAAVICVCVFVSVRLSSIVCQLMFSCSKSESIALNRISRLSKFKSCICGLWL